MSVRACFLKGSSISRYCTVRTWKFAGAERRYSGTACLLGLTKHSNSVNCFRWNSIYIFNKRGSYATANGIQLVFQERRAQSTATNTQAPISIDDLPEPPVPPSNLQLDLPVDTGLLEPTLASQGLAGWSPSGLLQSSLEFLHINLDMPWWLAIAFGTLVVRICLFPLVIVSQRSGAHLNNNLPRMQMLQAKMTQARTSGNALEAGRYAQELMEFMKEKKINPFKSMLIPLAQAPVFMSFFFGLRGMANLPVESMKEGGLWWFTNLTVPDPFYLLPLITCTTLFLTVELGVDAGIRTGSMQNMRYVLRALPVIIFPFIMSFPSAVLCYWATSNAISLVQVGILRLVPVREYFKIPKIIRHDPKDLPMKKKFVEGFRETFRNSKITREIEERARIDEVRFRQAGIGPIQKTYTYDPTKQSASPKTAKKKF